ncbi:AzlD domain-containing protein [Dethiobacter alkaliphilus]|uniref:AzlD domain-containing protein n=1 Tax=Dethiobacter alkaliphilus TaxID=427926 RepID=UPI0022269BFD|nr:AzlD domain-containing protein [Dethiobacter alkaliphilus]MCW3491120.1 AzlD domain-containing protein [Dethiobacter alkaliphilus]
MLIILGMAVVTYLPRFLPMYVLTRLEIPQIVIDWLRYIPVAVLAALIVPGILTADRQIHLTTNNAYLLASIPAFLVAWRSKNMMYTVTIGMAVVLLLQHL